MTTNTIKVLHLISPTGYFGAERWIVALAKNLDSNRVQCGLAVTIEDINENFEVIEKFAEVGKSVYKIQMRSRFDWSAVDVLCKLVVQHGYQIVHSHGYKSDVLALLVKLRLRSINIISTPHGYGVTSSYKLKFYHRVGLWANRRFDLVVPLSPALADVVEKSGVDQSRIRMIRNGVDLSEIEANVKPDYQRIATGRLGYVGRLSPGKQVDQILRVFELLWTADQKLELFIAGEGSERACLERLSSTLACRNSVTFLGYVEQRLQLMQSLEIFLMTSRSEGTPRSIMEAMAIGVPVVAYDVEGVDQLVEHQRTGLLARLDNTEELKLQCHRLLADPELAVNLTKNAREFVHESYSGERMVTEYTHLYESIVAVL